MKSEKRRRDKENYEYSASDWGDLLIKKTVNGVTTTYYLSGSQIVAEETNGNITVYIYDAQGLPLGMQYHASTYAAELSKYILAKTEFMVFRFIESE